MITDYVKLLLKAGDGGNGCVAFRREKYVAYGGPSGGDGGKGGDIILTVDDGANTLLAYRYRRKFIAQNGEDGKSKKCHGADGPDLVLPVPPGTLVRDAATGKIIHDMSDGEPFVVCRGGKGGWGNARFATSTRQIPRFAKAGLKGEEKEVILELKMLADVGLIGMPNVGKSSILAKISAARPKIADYNFTTLSPNLGVVKTGDDGAGFVVADIPGLIEGASEGAGLGHDFLRHIERCRLLVHVVDISGMSGRDPREDMRLINEELKKYDKELALRPQIIAGNKYDMVADSSLLEDFEKFCDEYGYEHIYISAVTGYNIKNLIHLVSERLKLLPPIKIYEPELKPEDFEDKKDREVTVKKEGGKYIVEGEWLERLIAQVNFSDRDSLHYFQRVLRRSGVIDVLEAAGATDGDTVRIFDFEFEFIK
ncbi:MAG: GTPase ObgE [Eubacteriales bacterium]|jgi:GTP-binding protein|nr:GTPase ObgE [Clostridiales bacterium]